MFFQKDEMAPTIKPTKDPSIMVRSSDDAQHIVDPTIGSRLTTPTPTSRPQQAGNSPLSQRNSTMPTDLDGFLRSVGLKTGDTTQAPIVRPDATKWIAVGLTALFLTPIIGPFGLIIPFLLWRKFTKGDGGK